jgi:hypothetical protein
MMDRKLLPDSINEWDDRLMVHGWRESGPGAITFDEMYLAFKARMELERHEQSCCLRTGEWSECDCGLSRTTSENDRG